MVLEKRKMDLTYNKILGIDPGEKRIGVAIADKEAKLAAPFCVIKHISREKNADRIVSIALENCADLIVIGQSLDENGNPSNAGRAAARLAEMITDRSQIKVFLWDESLSTHDAIEINRSQGKPHKRKGHMDDLAAAVILQSYLDFSG